jgi:hypothetical protein
MKAAFVQVLTSAEAQATASTRLLIGALVSAELVSDLFAVAAFPFAPELAAAALVLASGTPSESGYISFD